MVLKLIHTFFLIFIVPNVLADEKDLKPYTADLRDAFLVRSMIVCVDNSDSYPYYFSKEQQLNGVDIDIVSEAIGLERISFSFLIEDFTSCLNKARKGEVDAIIDVAYTKERANYIKYPENAQHAHEKAVHPRQKSVFEKYAIGTVDYVVVTIADSRGGYIFNGDPKTLPTPVRVVQDDSIVEYLEQFNIDLQKNKSAASNFASLASSGIGSVIEVRSAANFVNKSSDLAGKFFIHSEMIYRENLYLGFSKDTKVADKLIHNIWSNIEKLKNKPSYMMEVFNNYRDDD